MKYFLFLICISSSFWAEAQSSTTTTSGGQKNTQVNSAYVTPVVTTTYTPKADPYIWDNNKNSFTQNSSYTAPTGGTVTSGGNYNGRLFGRPRSEIRAEKLYLKNSAINSVISSANTEAAPYTKIITDKVNELAKHYNEGNYYDALECCRKIGAAYDKLIRISNGLYRATGIFDMPGYPSVAVQNTESFYSLLTYNKTGRNKAVLNEYANNYTSCFGNGSINCVKEPLYLKSVQDSSLTTCNIRQCPEKISTLEGLSIEDIFEIELAYTESAALEGYKDFATENLKSIMHFYAGKIQLSPYYLYLAVIVTATDQKEYANKFFDQFVLENGNTLDGQKQIKYFLQNMAMYYFEKGANEEGKAYMDKYLKAGTQTMAGLRDIVSAFDDKRYALGRENKMMTAYLEMEMDSLLVNKEFIASKNNYCLMLGYRSKLYASTKQYQRARDNMDFTKKVCPDFFYQFQYDELRCLTGEADEVIAEWDKMYFKKDKNGKPEHMSFGGMMGINTYFEILNNGGQYAKCVELFDFWKGYTKKYYSDYPYENFKRETGIAYYYLKDYSNARKMFGNSNDTPNKYKRYMAKLFALEGNIPKAKELYQQIKNDGAIHFDEEDIRTMDQ